MPTATTRPSMPAMSAPKIKLKDKIGRQIVLYDLKKVFGFIPTTIAVAKVEGEHDTFIVSALLTDEMIEKEEKK